MLGRWRMGPWAKECKQCAEARKVKETDFSPGVSISDTALLTDPLIVA